MTTFIFMLTKEAGDAAVERVITELGAAFPQHEFIAGEASIGGYENSILAMHGSAGSIEEPGTVIFPKESDVTAVIATFRQIIEDLKGWKPS
jgi:hypothetical protein